MTKPLQYPGGGRSKMSLEDVKRLEYVGGGYYRLPGPKGKARPIVHGPELLQLFREYIASKGD